MEAPGMAGKAAKERGKYLKQLNWKVRFPVKISENKPGFGGYCHFPSLMSCSFLFDLLNAFLKYAGSITYAVLIWLNLHQNK